MLTDMLTNEPAASGSLAPISRPIVKATDPRATAVLRLGALTLVADPFGDLRPDTRGLGLYLGDTRVLSTLGVLIDGRRPTLLEPDLGGGERGVIQMTNPELRNDPTLKPNSPTLATQSLGIRRERVLAHDGLHETLSIANYTMARQELIVELLLAVDGADIFEVRGYSRPDRGELLPIEIDRGSARFAYVARDGLALRTIVTLDPEPDGIGQPPSDSDASVRASWRGGGPPRGAPTRRAQAAGPRGGAAGGGPPPRGAPRTTRWHARAAWEEPSDPPDGMRPDGAAASARNAAHRLDDPPPAPARSPLPAETPHATGGPAP